MKKILSVLLSMTILLCCMGVPTFAVSPSTVEDYPAENEDLGISTFSFGGYGHRVTGTGSGYFEVNAPSGALLSAGITISSECGSSNAFSYISIEKPDGTFFKNDIYLDGNAERKFNFGFPQNGTYKIHYTTYTPDQTVHLQCWIYG